MSDDISMEQASGESYAEHLRSYLRAIGYYEKQLTKSYMEGTPDRDSHYELISLCRGLFGELIPKIEDHEMLKKNFKDWLWVKDEPMDFMKPRYEKLIWLFIDNLRNACHHLNLTNIDE